MAKNFLKNFIGRLGRHSKSPADKSGHKADKVASPISDEYPSIKRTTFARGVFKYKLTGIQARYAIRAIIRDHLELKRDLRKAGYDLFGHVPYTSAQHRILSEYLTRHSELIDTYFNLYKNWKKS